MSKKQRKGQTSGNLQKSANQKKTSDTELSSSRLWWWILAIGAVLAIPAAVVGTLNDWLGFKAQMFPKPTLNAITTPSPPVIFNLTPTAPPLRFAPGTEEETLVLVADFQDSVGTDSSLVTQVIVEQIRATLKNHSTRIRVEYLGHYISPTDGSNYARHLGLLPEYQASIIIWGNYTLIPEIEVHVHFDLMKAQDEFLGLGFYEPYGPTQIQQPNMFDFKFDLGNHLGQMVAFAAGVSLFNANHPVDALALFETAAQTIKHPLGQRMKRIILAYRGITYFLLEQPTASEADLRQVIPEFDTPAEQWDEIAIKSLNAMGGSLLNQGRYDEGEKFFKKYTEITGDEATSLTNLAIMAFVRGDRDTSRQILEQAVKSNESSGDYVGLGIALLNLGRLDAWRAPEVGIQRLERAREILEEKNYLSGLSTALYLLGHAKYELGDRAAAITYLEQAYRVYSQIGDLLGMAQTYCSLEDALNESSTALRTSSTCKHAVELQIEYYDRALEIDRNENDSIGQVIQLNMLGFLAEKQSKYDLAENYYKEALQVAEESGQTDARLEQIDHLTYLARQRGQYSKALDLSDQALSIAVEENDLDRQANLFSNIGDIYNYQLRDYTTAQEYYEKALAIKREQKNVSGQVHLLENLARLASVRKQIEQITTFYEEAIKLESELGDVDALISLLNSVGDVLKQNEKFADALGYYERALILVEQQNNLPEIGWQLKIIGDLYCEQKLYDLAESHYKQALQIDIGLGDFSGQSSMLYYLSELKKEQGEFADAKNLLERALQIEEEHDNVSGQIMRLDALALLAKEQKQFTEAANIYNKALDLSKKYGDFDRQVQHLTLLGELAKEQGNYDTARTYFEQALQVKQDQVSQNGELDRFSVQTEVAIIKNLAALAIADGEPDRTIELYEDILELYRQITDENMQAATLFDLGNFAYKASDLQRTTDYFERSAELYAATGNLVGQISALENLGLAARVHGNFKKAEEAYLKALVAVQTSNDLQGEARQFGNLALSKHGQKDIESALKYLQQSKELYQRLGLEMPTEFKSALEEIQANSRQIND